MATHDYNLANQSGASFRSDLNNALAAILSNNSNGSSPTTVVAYMIWVDTSANKLKIRNSANSGWIELLDLDGDITRDITFNGASANIEFDTSDNELNFKDNAKATFGNSADLTITHDGGSSIINDTGTGELLLQRAGDTMVSLSSTGIVVQDPGSTAQVEIKGFESSNANLLLKADEGDDNGDTWLIQSQASTQDLKIYNDISGSNVEKFAINNDGDISLTGHVSVDDNHEVRIGNGNDFIFSHDTSGTDHNVINCANDHDLFINHGTENMAIFRNDADVELFYNGTKRFETLDTGVHLIGTATTGNIIEGDCRFKQAGSGTTELLYDSSANQVQFVDDVKCAFGASSDLKIFHDTTGSANVNVIDSGPDLEIRHGTEPMAIFYNDAQVELYHNNALRLSTTSSGIKVTRTGGTSSDVTLEIESENDSASDAILQLQCLDTTAHARINFGDSGDADNGQIDYDNANLNLTFRVNGTNEYEMDGAAFHPISDDSNDVGRSDRRFDDIRATNGSIQTSDKNEKNTIVASDLGLDFINKLSPVSYKFNNKTRTHYGLIAQDIETVLSSLSKTATDFAGFCKDQIASKTELDEDGFTKVTALETPFDRYGLRYTEFIAPMIKAIQELSAKVTALEGS